MIHYHGTPISPDTAAAQVLTGRHAFISFGTDRQSDIASEVCQSFALDNGAFGAWRAGTPITDWGPYYEWSGSLLKHPRCDWAICPDVIDGDEDANDDLLGEWPHAGRGVPVWHLHESLTRLDMLVEEWPRVALGSSGMWDTPGTPAWWARMTEAMAVACTSDGIPRAKLHGLRMLAPEVFRYLPLSSADSVNVGRNVGMDGAWSGTYAPPTKGWRAVVIAARVESINSAPRWIAPPKQFDIFERAT